MSVKTNMIWMMAFLALAVIRGQESPILQGVPSQPMPKPATTNQTPPVPIPPPSRPETNFGPSQPLPDPPPTNSHLSDPPAEHENPPLERDIRFSHGITNNPLPWAATNSPPEGNHEPRPSAMQMVADAGSNR